MKGEYYIWLHNEIEHGLDMDAPTRIPAGSMLSTLYGKFWPSDIKQNEIHREGEMENDWE